MSRDGRSNGFRIRRAVARPRWLAASFAMTAALAVATVAAPATASASPASSRMAATVAGTPCGAGVVACVTRGKSGFNGTAWFVRNGKVVRGPVDATTGGPGEDTPVGTFHVLSKDLHHASTETNNAQGQPSPMPYSVFFTKSGVAFHGGGALATRTAGCVRLANDDASYFFDHLDVGDTVQVVDGTGPAGDEGDSHHSGDKGGGLLGGL